MRQEEELAYRLDSSNCTVRSRALQICMKLFPARVHIELYHAAGVLGSILLYAWRFSLCMQSASSCLERGLAVMRDMATCKDVIRLDSESRRGVHAVSRLSLASFNFLWVIEFKDLYDKVFFTLGGFFLSTDGSNDLRIITVFYSYHYGYANKRLPYQKQNRQLRME